MKRPPKRMALYEAIAKKKTKPLQSKNLEPLKPVVKEKKATPRISALPEKSSEKQVKWTNKPKLLQLNAGRVELSIPYQVAVAVVLVAFVVVLLAFRFGKASARQTAGIASAPVVTKKIVKKPVSRPVVEAKVQDSDLPTGLVAKEPEQKPVMKKNNTGNNIVIQALRSRNDLEPVKDYFAANGIATEIKKVKSWYYLITVNKYESLKTSGSQGNNMLKKIVKLGAGYKSPQGFESFRVKGKTPFQDAYGMKFED